MYFYTRNCASKKTTYPNDKVVFSPLRSHFIHQRFSSLFSSDSHYLP
jgi:hypothetical protein